MQKLFHFVLKLKKNSLACLKKIEKCLKQNLALMRLDLIN